MNLSVARVFVLVSVVVSSAAVRSQAQCGRIAGCPVPAGCPLCPVEPPAGTCLSAARCSPAIECGPFFRAATGRSYFVLSSSRWTEANEAAASLFGTALETIEDSDEDQFIRQQIIPVVGSELWIGLNAIGRGGFCPNSFVWADGSDASFRNWKAGQPTCEQECNLAKANVVAIDGTGWNDSIDSAPCCYGVRIRGLIGIECPDEITADPEERSATTGGTVRFSFGANVRAAPNGNLELAITWRKDGRPLEDGMTESGSVVTGTHDVELVIEGVSPADEGCYEVELVTFCHPSLRSECAHLTVRDPMPWKRCDVNCDGTHDVSDAVSCLLFLFVEETAFCCPLLVDCNRDGSADISDCIALLDHLFRGTPALPAPFWECGTDEGKECPGYACP